MLFTEDVVAFLEAQEISAPILPEGEEQDMPDEIVTIGVQSGLSSTYEYLFDRPAIRVRIRGRQADRGSAETLAGQVDAAMLALGRQTLGGEPVTAIQRLSGPPGFVGVDSANARRAWLEATYIVEVASQLPV